MQFNILYGIRMPSKDDDRKSQTYHRGFKRQGGRHDEFLQRMHDKDLRQGLTTHVTVPERIVSDRNFRLKLARKVVTCNANYAPAQILCSTFCRQAYRAAIANGEITYENVGYRVRQPSQASQPADVEMRATGS
jgi:hypothetical protein